MSRPDLKKNLRRLPKLGALALGFGGLIAAEAPAENSKFQPIGTSPGPSRQRDLTLDAVVMRLNGETIYISQRGGALEELALGDTQQATYLRQLLRDAGAAEHPVTVPIGSIVVANGGGAGDGKKPATEEIKPEPATGTASEKKQPDKKAKQPPAKDSGSEK